MVSASRVDGVKNLLTDRTFKADGEGERVKVFMPLLIVFHKIKVTLLADPCPIVPIATLACSYCTINGIWDRIEKP